MAFVILFIIPIGVGSAIFLEEYASKESRCARAVEVNIQNLAAVPSIIYGLLGLAFVARGPLSLGFTVITASITLALLVLPIVILVAPGGDSRRTSVDPGRIDGTGGNPSADHAQAGVAGGNSRDRDRRDPGDLARDRRDGAVDPARRRDLRHFRSEWADERIHRAAAWSSSTGSSNPRPSSRSSRPPESSCCLAVLIAMNSFAIWLRNRYEQRW